MLINPLQRREKIQADLLKARSGYEVLWQQVIGDWRSAEKGCYGWLTYSANYLFSFDGLKWGLDTYAMPARIQGMRSPSYRADLAPLSLMVLTHAHRDHLDTNLIQALINSEVQWVIPEHVQEVLRGMGALPGKNVITPVPGQPIQKGALRLLPFESLHLHGVYGVPETGYLVEYQNQRWLFPGDVRVYDNSRLPDFGRLDGVVAHLWLGKACAMDEEPPFLDAFCQFFSRFGAEHLFITHLNEFGRDENELWSEDHFYLVKTNLKKRAPGLKVQKFLMGDRMIFNPSAHRME